MTAAYYMNPFKSPTKYANHNIITFKRNKEEEAPEETELSVDDLLTTTQEHQTVEDIDLESKSEVRLMVEKFVDENPDASAQLLRNWLNEEWG